MSLRGPASSRIWRCACRTGSAATLRIDPLQTGSCGTDRFLWHRPAPTALRSRILRGHRSAADPALDTRALSRESFLPLNRDPAGSALGPFEIENRTYLSGARQRLVDRPADGQILGPAHLVEDQVNG